MKYLSACILFIHTAFAMFVGNPSMPSFTQSGLFTSKNVFKFGFIYDYVYKGRYKDTTIAATPTNSKLLTQTAYVSVNFHKRLDIYTLIGQSRMQLDQFFYSHYDLAWAVGGKLIVYKYKLFTLGLDGKYFQSKLSSNYFIIEKELANLLDTLYFNYKEIQTSLAFSYASDLLVPYAGVTYLYSDINPNISSGLMQFSDNVFMDFDTSRSESRKNWGMVLGVSILQSSKSFVNAEVRMFNQEAVSIAAIIRF